MKKTFFLLVGLLGLISAVSAQQYKILYISTPSISIGERDCHIGDIFNKEDLIRWQDEKQVLKAEDMDSKEQFIISPRMLNQRPASNTLGAYLRIRKSLASRGGDDELSTPLELADFFSKPIDLDQEWRVDYIPEEPGVVYYIEYEYQGERIPKQLHYEDGALFISRDELYQIDGQPVPQIPLNAGLYCYDELEETSRLLSETVIIPK